MPRQVWYQLPLGRNHTQAEHLWRNLGQGEPVPATDGQEVGKAVSRELGRAFHKK